MNRMPGSSFTGRLPPLTPAQDTLAGELEAHVRMLSESIGERHVRQPAKLAMAADHVETELRRGDGHFHRETFVADEVEVANLVLELPGRSRPAELLVIGAHYDSLPGCPAANDNGSAVAGLLALARRLRQGEFARTVRLVGFVNEEPPYFQGHLMGSRVCAKGCRARGERVAGMISLETIGYYSDQPKSQHYPWPVGYFYPDTGNFVAWVGNCQSAGLVRRCVGIFRERTRFPCEGAALPGWLPGIGWSDHWAFWQEGYPALMVTDTAPFRYRHYHRITDTWEKLDYPRMARVMEGVLEAVRVLADDP